MTSSSVPDQALTVGEAHALVVASVAHLADALGARIMLIKGPTLQAYGLREPRQSSDVDLLVALADLESMTRALASRGWHINGEDATAHVIPQHSITLVHDRWPLELDLHHRFPGFLEDPVRVFDVLWGRRKSMEQAHRQIAIPDLSSSVLIAALHYERSPEFNESSLRDLRSRVERRLSEVELRDLAECAAQTGCADTLRAFLEAVGAPAIAVGSSPPEALAAWQLNAAGGRITGLAWFDALRRVPWRQRPRLIWDALMFTEEGLRVRYPDMPPGRRGIWIARYRRLLEAIKAAPRALRVLRAHRRR